MSNRSSCETCCDTGIVRAALVKREDNSNERVDVILCGAHFDAGLSEKNLSAIEKTGIPVNVAGVHKPQE